MNTNDRTKIIYRFTLGNPIDVSKDLTPLPPDKKAYNPLAVYDNIDPENPNGYVFTNHNIVFSCKKTSKPSTTNSLEVSLYNLDDSIIEHLKINRGNNMLAMLEVGDNSNGLKSLFTGTVAKVVDNNNKETRITRLTLKDGAVNKNNAFTIRTFEKGTKLVDIIRDVSKDLQLPFGQFDDKQIEEALTEDGFSLTIDSPRSIYGKSIDFLKTLLPKRNISVNVQDLELNVVPLKRSKKENVAYISKNTGLLGRVSNVVDDIKSKASDPSVSKDSISFNCLMDASIKPDVSVYVKDGNFEGSYKVTSVRYVGNYEGNQWICQVVASRTDAYLASDISGLNI